MKKQLLIALLIFGVYVNAQDKKVVLSKEAIEAKFLEQNFDLLAKRIEISQEEALLIQAKLWPNPTFEISEVNLWKTTDIEEQDPIWGNWGKAQQISLHLEQEIQTAKKRRKNIALQQLTIEERALEFETILRETKLDLRATITQIQGYQLLFNLYSKQIEQIKMLTKAYKNQFDHGNISQAEYVRLKAEELKLQKDFNEVKKEHQEALKELKNFIALKAYEDIYIPDDLLPSAQLVSELEIENWITAAVQDHPELLLTLNNEEQAKKRLEIEKAERIPDLTLSVDYDRAGGIMKNFVGFGVAFDLPILNRNKGNIKEAKLEIRKSELETSNKVTEITNNIIESFKNYNEAVILYKDIDENHEQQLDKLINAYYKNFEQKNVSLIEYLDFLDAYIDNKTMIIEAKQNLIDEFENLQYAVGKELLQNN